MTFIIIGILPQFSFVSLKEIIDQGKKKPRKCLKERNIVWEKVIWPLNFLQLNACYSVSSWDCSSVRREEAADMLLYQVSLDVISPLRKLPSSFPVLNNQYRWIPTLKRGFNASLKEFTPEMCVVWTHADNIIKLQPFIGIFHKHAWVSPKTNSCVTKSWHDLMTPFKHWSSFVITGGESVAQARPFIGHLHEARRWGESARYRTKTFIHSHKRMEARSFHNDKSKNMNIWHDDPSDFKILTGRAWMDQINDPELTWQQDVEVAVVEAVI